MRARTEEGNPSAPQDRGTETLPPNASGRKIERPVSGQDPLNRCIIETPATKAGSNYALIPARLLCIPSGELLVLAVLLSQRRSNGTFLRSLTFGARPVHLREDARGARRQPARQGSSPPCRAQADA